VPLPAPCCQLLRMSPSLTGPVHTARPGDELVLLVELPAAVAVRVLAVELFRGADRRDGWECVVPSSAITTQRVCRLRWRDRPDASSRLTCRVHLDGRQIGEPSVLLVGSGVDAQGRLSAPPPTGMSDHTRMAVLGAFDQLLAPSGENSTH
jgi:hypothetical protein